jgi:GH25 family lysozyme M1 (1,4-beta-N-acetylmuramidase)
MSTFYGIDISNNNGNVDLTKVKTAGYPFIYVKATEGQSFKDKYMETYYNDCKDLQLKVGAYHFLVETSTPEAQAENFYSMIKDYKWDLIPMLDVETMENTC